MINLDSCFLPGGKFIMSLAKDLDYAENSVPIITQLSLEI
jgi:hypothetical protein